MTDLTIMDKTSYGQSAKAQIAGTIKLENFHIFYAEVLPESSKNPYKMKVMGAQFYKGKKIANTQTTIFLTLEELQACITIMDEEGDKYKYL